ncbi:MAG: LapA family protein [Nitrospinae bacterium]|nr:LapA family protein [Nitrospinota bacterium]
MPVKFIIFIILAIIVSVLAVKNMDLVEVSFYDFYLNSHNVRVPLLVVVLASLSFGFFLAWLDGFIAKLKLKATIRRNGKAIQSLTEELERYKKSTLSEHNESGK